VRSLDMVFYIGWEVAHQFRIHHHFRCGFSQSGDCHAKRPQVIVRRKTPVRAVSVFDNYWATTLAFARSLGRRGVPLHFYGSGAGRWSRYCTRHMRCPPAERVDEFQPWLREKLRGGEIARIAPTTDLIAFHVSMLRDEFSPEVQRTIAPLAEIENCLIKTRFCSINDAVDSAALPAVAPDSLDTAAAAAAALGYPVMLKPKSHLAVGFAERGRLLSNESDLLRHYHRYGVVPGQEGVAARYPELMWPLLQRYIASARNRVYSVTGIKDVDSGVLTACVSYKREQWPPDVGVSTLQIACENPRILEFGLNVVNQTLSRGIFEVEVLAEDDVLYAIDLNPRAFGFVELDMARGADLPWLWYSSTLEVPVQMAQKVSNTRFQARHWLMHLFKMMAGVKDPAETALEEGRNTPGPGVSVSMLGHHSDPLPMILSNLYLLRHPRSLVRAQFASSRTGQPEKV
jgi:D-aspartate ligase